MTKKKSNGVVELYIKVDRPVTFLKPAKPSLLAKNNSEGVLDEVYSLLGLDKNGQKRRPC